MDERIWKIMGRKLRYSADEIQAFRARDENLDILVKATQINDLEIVAKVVSARGCADVGVENCGWGRVIVEISVRKRRPEAAL